MPIIRSLLDIDFYKLTMAQVAWMRHDGVRVKFAFTNRTKDVRIAEHVDIGRVREELAHVRTLRFSREELAYLETLGVFDPSFLHWLLGLQLPPVSVGVEDGQFRIEAEGRWPRVTFWETIVLSVVNELYYRATVPQGWGEGPTRLEEKCRFLAQEKYRDVAFAEFGTRRRFQAAWQNYVVDVLGRKKRAGVLPGFLGTSNVLLARQFGLRPIGTFAHEMDMVYSGIYHRDDDDIRVSHTSVLVDWWDAYGEPLSIALTDTYGTDFFFRSLSKDQARSWKGLRQDSGNPFVFAEKAIAFYEDNGVDPKTKTIVFSDGLDLIKVCALHARFKDRIGVAFGWGTNLTNDLGHRPLSLVMKAVESNGHPTVKLSDNPAKATGPTGEVERYKRIFGHVDGEYEACRY